METRSLLIHEIQIELEFLDELKQHWKPNVINNNKSNHDSIWSAGHAIVQFKSPSKLKIPSLTANIV